MMKELTKKKIMGSGGITISLAGIFLMLPLVKLEEMNYLGFGISFLLVLGGCMLFAVALD